MADHFHSHVCPECNGFWSHEDHCDVMPGEELVDSGCAAALENHWLASDQGAYPTDEELDAEALADWEEENRGRD